jgi:hypothetical protein
MFLKLNRTITAFIAICGASALFIALRFSEFIAGSVGDDAVYIEMARSIAEGRGPIVYLSEFTSYIPFAFPAGYPFLLSPIAFLFPHSIQTLQLASLILPFSVIPFYYICRHLQIDRMVIMGSISMVLLNPWIVAYSNRILSEASYTFFSYMALLAYIRWQKNARPLSPSLLVVLLTIGLSASIRTVGLALIAATLLHLLIRCKWSHLISLSIGLAVSMSPQLLANRKGGGSIISQGYHLQMIDHAHDVGTRLDFMFHNAWGYLNELPAALIPLFGNQVKSLCVNTGLEVLYAIILFSTGGLLLVLIAIGAWQLLLRHEDLSKVILLYLTFYTGAILNFSGWPSGIQLRLLVPIIPILYLLLLIGCTHLLSRTAFPQWTMQFITIAILTVSACHNFYRISHLMSQSRNDSGRGFVDYSAGSSWIYAHTLPTDTIMARYPLERHIHFNRPLVGYPEEATSIESLPLTKYNTSFLFISPGNPNSPDQLDDTELRMKRIAEENPAIFGLVYENRDKATFIYQIVQ